MIFLLIIGFLCLFQHPFSWDGYGFLQINYSLIVNFALKDTSSADITPVSEAPYLDDRGGAPRAEIGEAALAV
ncbi:MAG: hypothetical protein J6B60_00415 [Clostridia bacterium]|nr:hypothetical protein [Clostridia bacterium]